MNTNSFPSKFKFTDGVLKSGYSRYIKARGEGPGPKSISSLASHHGQSSDILPYFLCAGLRACVRERG